MRLTLPAAALAVCALAVSPATAQTPATGDLSGTWAKLLMTTSVSKIPVLGDVESVTRLYVRSKVVQRGDSLNLQNEACWARIEGPTSRVRTVIPPKMLDAIGPSSRTGTVRGRVVRIDRAVDVVGAELPQPGRDPLPERPDHPWVIDEDRDGYPGVTVRMMGLMSGDIRVVQRTWNEMEGTLSRDGARIGGLVKWRTEQSVLDATNRFLDSDPDSRPHPDPQRSRFSMVRVDPDTSCSDIVRQHRRLWPNEHDDR